VALEGGPSTAPKKAHVCRDRRALRGEERVPGLTPAKPELLWTGLWIVDSVVALEL